MLTIIHSAHSQLSPEAQAFFAEEPRPSAIARVVGFVAALDAACVILVLLAA